MIAPPRTAPICGHTHKQIVRGVCKRCYQVMMSMVAAEKTSWAELEKAGLVERKNACTTGDIRIEIELKLRDFRKESADA